MQPGFSAAQSKTAIAPPFEDDRDRLAPPTWRPFHRVNAILTLRGLLLTALGAWLILHPARASSDIVAAVFGSSLLLFTLAAAVLVFVQANRLRQRLSPRVSGTGQGENSYYVAGRPDFVNVSLNPFKLFPFLYLALELDIDQPGLARMTHQLSGAHLDSISRLIRQPVVFPHRGEWRVRGVTCSVSDALGLTKISWHSSSLESEHYLRASPAPAPRPELPVLSSTARPGDSVLDMNERQGEPYDLKPYHPSDGMRKIVWKLYAKRGELAARHPERSLNPEGQVVIFCASNKDEDAVCARVLNYADQLDELALDVYVGCEGMRERPVAFGRSAAEALLIDAVWDTEMSDGERCKQELLHTLSQVRSRLSGAEIERLIVFYDARRLISQSALQALIGLGTLLEDQRVKPAFAAVADERSAARSGKGKPGGPGSFIARISRLLLRSPEQSHASPIFYPQFVRVCATRNWRVL